MTTLPAPSSKVQCATRAGSESSAGVVATASARWAHPIGPSKAKTQSSMRSLAGIVMYITRLPSREIAGCVAFSEEMSVEVLVATLYSVRIPEDLPFTR